MHTSNGIRGIAPSNPVDIYTKAVAAEFQKTDRIISGRSNLKVVVTGSQVQAPAWATDQDIFINRSHIASRISSGLVDKANGDDNPWSRLMMALKGLNYHELCHILYTPGQWTPLRQALRGRPEFKAWNVLEDMRIEMLFYAEYKPTQPFFTYMVMEWVLGNGGVQKANCSTTDFIGGAYPWIAQRKYLPAGFRAKVRAALVKMVDEAIASGEKFGGYKSGENFASMIDNVSYRFVTTSQSDWEKLHGFTKRYHRLMEMLHSVAASYDRRENGVDSHDEIGDSGNTTDDPDEEKQKAKAVKQAIKEADEQDTDDTDDDADNDASGVADADDDNEEDDAAADSNGSDNADDEDDDADSGDNTTGDTGSDADDADDADNDADNNADNDADNDADDDGADNGEVNDSAGGAGDGSNPDADLNVDDFIDDIIEALDQLIESDAVVDDLDRSRQFIKDYIENNATSTVLPMRPSRPSVVSPDVAKTARKMTSELLDLRQDLESFWQQNETTGRFNARSFIRRAAVPGAMDFYDQWVPSNETEGGIETVVLLDVSTSMRTFAKGTRIRNDIASQESAWQIKRMHDEIDAPCSVLTYGTSSYCLYDANERANAKMWKLTTPNEGNTVPWMTLNEAARIFNYTEQPNRLLVILTDGDWYDDYKAHAIIDAMNDNGVLTVMVQIGDIDDDAHHCQVHHHLKDPTGMTKVVTTIVSELTKRAALR